MIRLFKVILRLVLFLTILRAGYFVYDWATFRWNSNACEENASQYLRKIGSRHSFNRCTQTVYPVKGTNRFLRRIYIVAGKVEKEWEFECGFFVDCRLYVAWSDDQGNSIEFSDPPSVISEDRAVVTLGCAEDGGMSEAPAPQLVLRDGAFAWLLEYRKYDTSKIYDTEIGCDCQISGDVYHYHDRIVSSLKIDKYRKFIEFDEKNLPIIREFDLPRDRDFLKAISLGNPDSCRHSRSINDELRNNWQYLCVRPREEFEHQALADWDKHCEVRWSTECLQNYIAATGETSICHQDIKTDYGLNCDQIKLIEYTNRQQASAGLIRDPGEPLVRRLRSKRINAYERRFEHPPFHW